MSTDLGFTVVLDGDFADVEAKTREALLAEGFGVLTEIDVKATFKKKLDVDFRPYKILGACSPPLAYDALTAAPDIGLLLPCNVTVAQTDDGKVEVALIDPVVMLGVAQNPDVAPIAAEVQARMKRALTALQA